MAYQRLELVLVLGLFASGMSSFAFVSQNGPLLARQSVRRDNRKRLEGTIGQRTYRYALYASSDSGEDWLAKITPPSDTTSDGKNGGAQLTTPLDDDQEPPEDLGNIQIPSTGISVTDQVEELQRDKFESELVPITELPGVAQIVTTANDGIIEPVRYLVSLSPQERPLSQEDGGETPNNELQASQSFVMVDIPPFSDKLLANMRKFMASGSKLTAMIITSRDGIHYDDAPAVFTTRRSDLEKWTAVFPDAQVIGYRLDIPRDCREMITQRLDGYGPWALEESAGGNVTFVETGRPLTCEVWDEDVAKQIMDEGAKPPDDELANDDERYTPKAIKGREQGKRLLAVYTPGHTFGSLTYIFPEIQVCCSGYTIPIEDDRYDEATGTGGGGGPALDFRGYVTTTRAGMSRMMESARNVVNTYSDRFNTVLPSRGDPLSLSGSEQDRIEALNDIIDQYDKIGKVYEQLGITSPNE